MDDPPRSTVHRDQPRSPFALVAVLILTAASIGAGLLTLRHQRYELMHQMTQLHREMSKLHHSLWSQQIQISQPDPSGINDDGEASSDGTAATTPAVRTRM